MSARGRFLIVAWDGGGNVPPALAAARRLVGRGHAVLALGPASLQERFEAAGCAFRRYSTVPEWDGTRGRALEDQPEVFLDLLSGEALAADVLEEIARQRPDTAIVDCMLGGALCALERASVPTAVLVHLLYRPWVDTWGASLHMDATRELLGLPALSVPPPLGLLDRTAAVLVLTAAELDTPGPLPVNTSYVGPLLDDDPAAPVWRNPWPDDDAPLVVVALSTTYQHQEKAMANILAAVGDLPVRALVTLGHGLRADEVNAPPNAFVATWIPHHSVLSHASLVVTHGGHGTVVVALAHGVPLLCAPLGREQPFNAERVHSLGAGEIVSPNASPTELRDAIEKLLGDRRYQRAASAVARTIASYQNGAHATEILERLLSRP